jgi:hypothetical protein
MAGPITPPQPGELITVTFVTSILNKLNELEGRILALEKPTSKDSSISISINFVNPSTAWPDHAVNNIQVPRAGVLIGLSAVFSQAGTYDISFVAVAPANNWTAIPTFDTQTTFTIPPSEIPPGGQTSRTPKVQITPTPGATPVAGPLDVRIQRQGAPNFQSITFNLTAGS